MLLHKFKDYETYKTYQIRGSRRRANRNPAVSVEEIGRIAQYLEANGLVVRDAICHGARCGTEVKLISDMFPGARVLGTDLSPRDASVLEWDFNVTKPEWVGAFDMVYSNSLDHSPAPYQCFKGWLSQLRPNGLLFLLWTYSHNLDHPYLNGGDCFMASLHEYIAMVRRAGKLHDLLWIERGKNGEVSLVIGRKG